MSYRDALKVFKLERELSDDETAFLNTLRSMSETERELTVEALSPQSSKKSTTKKRKKAAGKSARAASLQSAITSRKQPEVIDFADDTDMVRCIAMIDDNGGEMPCGLSSDANVHHLHTDPNYHEFVASTTAKDDNYQQQAGAATEGD